LGPSVWRGVCIWRCSVSTAVIRSPLLFMVNLCAISSSLHAITYNSSSVSSQFEPRSASVSLSRKKRSKDLSGECGNKERNIENCPDQAKGAVGLRSTPQVEYSLGTCQILRLHCKATQYGCGETSPRQCLRHMLLYAI
jgi:hypothetical protein